MTDQISISDASTKYDIHPNTIRRWIKLGAVAATKDDNGCWQISKSEVKKLLAARLKKLEKVTRKNG